MEYCKIVHHRFFSGSVFLISFYFLISFSLYAQKLDYKAMHYGADEGLSQGSVRKAIQDDKGFIWVTTADGLNRFDGYTFKVFRNQDSSATTLNSFRNIYKQGNILWITTLGERNLYRFDLVTSQFKKVVRYSSRFGTEELLPLKADKDSVWIVTNGQGLVKLNWRTGQVLEKNEVIKDVNAFENNFSRLVNGDIWYASNANMLCSYNSKTGTVSKHNLELYCSVADGQNNLWVATKNKIIQVNATNFEMQEFILSEKDQGKKNPISIGKILVYDDRTLWLATEINGVCTFDKKEKKFLTQDKTEYFSSIPLSRLSDLMIDKTENIWVGTDPYGLYKVDKKQKPFKHEFVENGKGLSSNFIKGFLQVGSQLYIATHDQGITVFDLKTGSYTSIKKIGSGLRIPIVYSMVRDSVGDIWLATEEGIKIIKKNTTTVTSPLVEGYSSGKYNPTFALQFLKDGSLLAGLSQGLYIIKKSKSNYVASLINGAHIVEEFLVDQSGAIWVCTGKGLYLLDIKRNYQLIPVIENRGIIKCVVQDKTGNVYAGSVSGLFKIDGKTKKTIKFYSEKDGLPNTFIYGILENEDGNLWLSTNKGLSRFDPVKENFRNYTVSDGLQSNEFNTGAYYKNASGEFFFGGVNGFNHFYPNEIKDNPYNPAPIITGFKIFDKPYVSDTSIEYITQVQLNYNENNLLLEYMLPEYSDPLKNTFSYKLKGLDLDWINAGKERFVRYPNLPPGEYVFELKGANNDGVWGDSITLHISILPPFWQTWWFRLITFISLLLSFYFLISYQTSRKFKIKIRENEIMQASRMNAIIETEEKERKRVAGELHDSLGQMLSTARLNVSSLSGSIPKDDEVVLATSLKIIDDACEEVRNISHNMMPTALIRLGLIPAIEEMVSEINGSNQLAAQFITNTTMRFSETKEITIYRIVQEVVNNMIKHAKASEIVISMNLVDEKIQLSIKDNGTGFDTILVSQSTGLGWKNIYSRVGMLEGTINIDSFPGNGTTVNVFFPSSN